LNKLSTTTRAFSAIGSNSTKQEGFTVSYPSCVKLNINTFYRDKVELETILLLIILMTQLLSEQVERALELLLVLLKLALKQLAFLSCSQQDHTLWLLKVELMRRLATCMMIVGNGTSMTQLKVVIGLLIKTQYNT
jgi:hypothetical protein